MIIAEVLGIVALAIIARVPFIKQVELLKSLKTGVCILMNFGLDNKIDRETVDDRGALRQAEILIGGQLELLRDQVTLKGSMTASMIGRRLKCIC